MMRQVAFASRRCRPSGMQMRMVCFSSSTSSPSSSTSSSSGSSSSSSSETQVSAGPEALDDRVEVAKKIQDLVKEGYRSLNPSFYAQAADNVERLPPGSLTRRYLSGFIMNGHGNLVVAKEGNNNEATELLKGAFEHALSEATEGLGDDRYSDIVSFASDLAISEAESGRLAEAEKLLKRALYWVTSSRVEPDRPLMVATLSNVGQVMMLQGRSAAALDHQERALVEAGNLIGDDNFLVRASMLTHLSLALRMEGIVDRSKSVALDAVETARGAYMKADSHSAIAQTANALSAALVNHAGIVLEAADSLDDILFANELAKEILNLEGKVDKTAAFLMCGVSANSHEHAIEMFEQAQKETTDPLVQKAIAHNLKGVKNRREGHLLSDDELTDATTEIDEASAQRVLLRRLPLENSHLFYKSQSSFIHGLTLRAFCM